jgi:tryptophan 2,3-dioxygenase
MTEDLRSPILPGTAASDYERYLRTDELLALQKPPEEMLHPDELTFQVTHQASELLMKGAAWELERVRKCLNQATTYGLRYLSRPPRLVSRTRSTSMVAGIHLACSLNGFGLRVLNTAGSV